MEISRDLLKTMRPELDIAIRTVASKFGLTFNGVGSIRFDASSFRTRLEFFGDASAVPKKKEESKEGFASLAPMFGLKPSDFNATVEICGSPHTIVGIKERAHKNNIVIRSRRGKDYVTDAATILRALGRKVPPSIEAGLTKAPWE
jgi:hypothetical protein